MSAPLPPCPLCGKNLIRYPHSKQIRCDTKFCPLAEMSWMSEKIWRRLAAPPLPPEVVAVLKAALRYWRGTAKRGDLFLAVTHFDNAGCPGLEKS